MRQASDGPGVGARALLARERPLSPLKLTPVGGADSHLSETRDLMNLCRFGHGALGDFEGEVGAAGDL